MFILKLTLEIDNNFTLPLKTYFASNAFSTVQCIIGVLAWLCWQSQDKIDNFTFLAKIKFCDNWKMKAKGFFVLFIGSAFRKTKYSVSRIKQSKENIKFEIINLSLANYYFEINKFN